MTQRVTQHGERQHIASRRSNRVEKVQHLHHLHNRGLFVVDFDKVVDVVAVLFDARQAERGESTKWSAQALGGAARATNISLAGCYLERFSAALGIVQQHLQVPHEALSTVVRRAISKLRSGKYASTSTHHDNHASIHPSIHPPGMHAHLLSLDFERRVKVGKVGPNSCAWMHDKRYIHDRLNTAFPSPGLTHSLVHTSCLDKVPKEGDSTSVHWIGGCDEQQEDHSQRHGR